MASMKGGHFLTVRLSSPMVGLNAFCGSFLNHSGRPSTAGIGRGITFSRPGWHRKVSVIWLAWSMLISRAVSDARRDLAHEDADALAALCPVSRPYLRLSLCP